jgi:hypothetical protein
MENRGTTAAYNFIIKIKVINEQYNLIMKIKVINEQYNLNVKIAFISCNIYLKHKKVLPYSLKLLC